MMSTKFSFIIILALGLLILPVEQVHAQCTSPAGAASTMYYNTGSNTYFYCKGTTWASLNMGVLGTTCAGQTGKLAYVSGEIVYCNGTNWVRTAPLTNYPASGTCDAARTGRFYYGAYNQYWYCNGTNWRLMGN